MTSSFVEQLPLSTTQDIEAVVSLSPFFGELKDHPNSDVQYALMDADERLNREQLIHRYEQALERYDAGPAEKLQRLRQQEMMRIVFRDLTRRADLIATTNELSHLADFCVGWALQVAWLESTEKYGTPLGPTGSPEQLIVIAMGKLGAYELNLSSDIDLIFLYSHAGIIERPGTDGLSHQEFFLRLSRRLIMLLDDAGSPNSVFRVDMRLRPYGDSGPLVLHRPAMEKYYVEQGRDWERYAFIKARVIAGDMEGGNDFLDWLKPFVYRRHLDYTSIQSLREMKRLITRQVELKQMNNDLKLGPGGIREIEFIAQAQQLIWGGRHRELQQPALLQVLDMLAKEEFLPLEDVAALKSAYVFLRNSEHAIQAEHDRQTHLLPVEAISQQRLATAMGFADFEQYLQVLVEHRTCVTDCFENLVSQKPLPIDPNDQTFGVEWFEPAESMLVTFREEFLEMALDESVVAAVNQLLPQLLFLMSQEKVEQALDQADADVLRERMLKVVSSILRRSTYIVFLIENADALERAVRLVAMSPWVAEQLSMYPILLYELTDRAVTEVAVSRLDLEGELREVLRSIDPHDLELQMDTLRQFKLAATMKIAAKELLDEVSIMQASDGLTALAEVLLESAADIAWRYLEAKHGVPCDDDHAPLTQRLAMIAYGKAGGLELAYGSDLDLVFLCPDEIAGSTDGSKPVNNNVFFVRLGQRIIHILTSFTRFGILYSIDMRLRPQGNKGPLVATIGAFSRYQHNDAWTWEHQALIRARFVAGDRELGEAFTAQRALVLETDRDPLVLKREVVDMREKMRTHLASSVTAKGGDDASSVLGRFDLKHDAGAIVDIEFMVQYAVLAHASMQPALSRWTDVMRLLDELARTQEFSGPEVDALQRAYLTLRTAVHEQWLGLPADFDRLHPYRDKVRQIWDQRMLTEGH